MLGWLLGTEFSVESLCWALKFVTTHILNFVTAFQVFDSLLGDGCLSYFARCWGLVIGYIILVVGT